MLKFRAYKKGIDFQIFIVIHVLLKKKNKRNNVITFLKIKT